MNERIKKLRKALDLTQQEFAERIGSVQNTITGYETGRRVPSSQVITLICKVFSVSETWLRTGEGEMFVQLPKNEALEQQLREFLKGGNDTFRERLISLLLRLPPEHWEALEHYAQELIDSRPAQSAVPTLFPVPPPIGRESDPVPEGDLTAKVDALEQQNRELMARLEAMEKEDAEWEAECMAQSVSRSPFP